MHLVERFLDSVSGEDPAAFLKWYDGVEQNADFIRGGMRLAAAANEHASNGTRILEISPGVQATSAIQRMTPPAVDKALRGIGWKPYDEMLGDSRRILSANASFLKHMANAYEQVPYDWQNFTINHASVDIKEEPVFDTPFFRVDHIKRSNPDGSNTGRVDPKVIVFVPASGHGPSLLEETVRRLAHDHEVYVAYHKDATHIPVSEGDYGFDDMVESFIAANERVTAHDPYGDGSGIGQRANNLPVCQPGPAVLAATAFMAEDNHPRRPMSLIALASPMDTDIAPTSTNDYAHSKPFGWFKNSVIFPVHAGKAGEGRDVYPGHMQRLAFIFKNEASVKGHMEKFGQFYKDLIAENAGAVAKKVDFDKKFFFDIQSLTARLYLDTIRIVFQENQIANGAYVHPTLGAMNLSAITNIAMHAADGTKDDICGFDPALGYGQTGALLALTPSVPVSMKSHKTFDAGHYMFSGKAWQTGVGDWTAERIRLSDTQKPWSPRAYETQKININNGLATPNLAA